jgi:phosphonate transport system ATP-binding protein
MSSLLELSDLRVATADGSPILRAVTLHVDSGERVAVVGRSGAGKTTLFRALNGTVSASGGRIAFCGEDVTGCRGERLRRLRRDIAVVAQKHDLVENLRVHQNVMAGALGRWSGARALRYLLWPTAAELETAEEALAAVGLAHKLREPTATLSGGEQQRVAIARALVQQPRLLLADEPVASLDPQTSRDILGLLCRLAQERHVALLCTLHQPDLAARYFERVVEIHGGVAVESRSQVLTASS